MTKPDPAVMPPEASARLTAIRRSLPAGWTVARTWQDAGGGWVAELTDQAGNVMAQVLLYGT